MPVYPDCPTSQVENRRKSYGFNELEKAPPTPMWKLILAQFDDTLVKASGAACLRRAGPSCGHSLVGPPTTGSSCR